MRAFYSIQLKASQFANIDTAAILLYAAVDLHGVRSSLVWDRRKETAALISQNRRIVSDTGKRTKSSARQRFFSFPRCGGRCFLIDLPQA